MAFCFYKKKRGEYMAKIELDKYYTSKDLAKYCIDKTFEIIGAKNITEIIEPSAGNGSFSSQLENCIAYDIAPESEGIIKQDFLQLDVPYKKGRLIIGNPPFGNSNSLMIKFYKKAVNLGDYISFILPISQFNNNQKTYEFNLIHSEDLGLKEYSKTPLRCCFNIYQRPASGLNKTRPNYKLKDVDIFEFNRGCNRTIPTSYDFGMCGWGKGCCGKQVEYQGQYASEYYIIIRNEKFRKEILDLCYTTDWKNLYPSISAPRLSMWQIYKHFKENIKGIS